jgi:fluoride exporter
MTRISLPAFRHVVAVFAGGMAGAAARHALLLAYPNTPGQFPQTTFVENLLGALLLGVFLTVVLRGWRWRFELRPLLATGLLGAFTTFATFTVEIGRLVEDGHLLVAATYGMASLAGGLAMALLGVWVGRVLPLRGLA